MSEKLYTIKEIAEIIGVSKQAVHKKIKHEPLSTSLRQFMTTKDNTIYITVDGYNLINTTFSKDNATTVDSNDDDNKVDETTTKFIDSLQSQITFLIEQVNLKDDLLKEKDKKIDELIRTITDLTERLAILFENSQQLQKNQQLLEAQNIIHEDVEPPKTKEKKQSFIKRLLKK